MIHAMHIENFKCFKDFDIELGPFNVLIGPNDTGKTALLESLRILAALYQLGDEASWDAIGKKARIALGQHCHWQNSVNKTVVFRIPIPEAGGMSWDVRTQGTNLCQGVYDQVEWSTSTLTTGFLRSVGDTLSAVGFYHLRPSELRQPSPIIDALFLGSGAGFPTFLDSLAREHRPTRFEDLVAAFRDRFPWYSDIFVRPRRMKYSDFANDRIVEKDSYELWFRTTQDAELPAQAVSDGLLLSLAFMAIARAPEPPTLLLIEEPETGVHHASLKEIAGTLKGLAEKGTQVIVTTHSPYLLDLVEPEEVRVFSKDEEGAVHAVRLSDYPDIAKLREQDFMTGEIWSMLSESKIVDTIRGAGAAK